MSFTTIFSIELINYIFISCKISSNDYCIKHFDVCQLDFVYKNCVKNTYLLLTSVSLTSFYKIFINNFDVCQVEFLS